MPGTHKAEDGPRDERGIVIITLALSLTVIMLFAAIAIDSGMSYSIRRSMQNSADAGVMDGAQAVAKAQAAGSVTLDATLAGQAATWPAVTDCSGSVPATDVYAHVYCSAIVRNGGALPTDGEDFCDVIDVNGNSLGKCYDASLPNPEAAVLALNPLAVGVKVVTENSRQTFFGNFAGQPNQVVRARAAASVQPVGGGAAPYVVCGYKGVSGYDFFTNPATGALRPDADLKAQYGFGGTNAPNVGGRDPNAAMIFEENSPQVPDHSISCGAGSSTDGKGDAQIHLSGDLIQAIPGNGSNPNPNPGSPIGLNACPADVSPGSLGPNGCDILLPIADSATGNGKNTFYHVAGWGIFHIEAGSGNQKVIGWYDGRGSLTGGFTQFGTCPPTNAACIVKLIDFPGNGLLE